MFDPQAINNQNCFRSVMDNIERPRTIDIARNILSHEKCHELQQKNNIYYLEIIEAAANAYIDEKFKFDRSYFQENLTIYQKGYTSRKRTESKDVYALNRYTENLFAKIDEDIDTEIHEYHNFQKILAPYSGAELDRLKHMIEELIRIYLYKDLSLLAFDLDAFDVALTYHDYAIVLYSGAVVQIDYESKNYLQREISAKSKKAVNKRWEENNQDRPNRKNKYLKIMREKNFPSAAKAAEHIYINENEKNLAYSTILRYLRAAVKGDFS
ncbi:hypothetical protein [Psychrobacter sp. DAB_AL32B]|uniref:hypothetical protein n=1 Tax=Psychrobacter sp. DAB_AL32B TaxID=1028414 RepID=UPI000B7E6279|nr:hypothetical protein [Psychrobacter sp. DAB_AL32B]OXL24648.1 hypothetical protein CAN34_05255 [Psychrobacter sp. DAB_AL32B]